MAQVGIEVKAGTNGHVSLSKKGEHLVFYVDGINGIFTFPKASVADIVEGRRKGRIDATVFVPPTDDKQGK